MENGTRTAGDGGREACVIRGQYFLLLYSFLRVYLSRIMEVGFDRPSTAKCKSEGIDPPMLE